MPSLEVVDRIQTNPSIKDDKNDENVKGSSTLTSTSRRGSSESDDGFGDGISAAQSSSSNEDSVSFSFLYLLFFFIFFIVSNHLSLSYYKKSKLDPSYC